MNETRSIRYMPWEDQPDICERCRNCMKCRTTGVGVLKKRRVYGRDGDTHTEYKVQCNLCNAQTDTHRSKLIALKEWTGKQEPEDGLTRRSKMPPERKTRTKLTNVRTQPEKTSLCESDQSRTGNIALNREAKTKGDGRK